MQFMDTLSVMESLKEYSSPKSKLTRMIKSGEIIQEKSDPVLFISIL